MIKMQKIKAIAKRAFAPVSIMLIPHHNSGKSIHLNIPAAVVLLSAFLCVFMVSFLVVTAIDVIKYRSMDKHIREYAARVSDFNVALASLKKAERDLHQLLSLGSKDKVLQTALPAELGRVDVGAVDIDATDVGAIDINQLRQQIAISMQTVGAIQDYLQSQKNFYLATPRGWPVDGKITSDYGRRINPQTGLMEFHRAIDIAVPDGTPIITTADGVVSFSGWSGGGGNVIVIEHGFGYSTYYAHNRQNLVQIGQQVKRGDVIGYAGRTGNATGSHVHYEIWKGDRVLNPMQFVQGEA